MATRVRVAGTISSHGNPWPGAAAWEGRATNSAYEPGRNTENNTNSNDNNNVLRERYRRHDINDAKLWKVNYNKRKYGNISGEYGSPDNKDHLPPSKCLKEEVDPKALAKEADAALKYFEKWHVPRVGNIPVERPEGVYRLMGAQLNNVAGNKSRDKKVDIINHLIDRWDVQGGCFQEVGINWNKAERGHNMTSWFKFDRRELRTNTSHNVNENITFAQQGGVAQFICKELSQYARETEPDFRGLGRWCSWLLYSNPSHKTRVVAAYNVGKNTSEYLGTIYQQHLRYIQHRQWNTTPRNLFRSDFLTAISRWQGKGERLLIFADMNEHILNGPLASRLLDLGLEEATHKNWNGIEPNSYVSGSSPIDAVYHSSSLEITASVQLSFHEGVGDHRTVLIDVSSRSLLGTNEFRIVRPAIRRLNCSNKKSLGKYIKYVEKELEDRHLHDKLCQTSSRLWKDPSDSQALAAMEDIDKQTAEVFIAGEKQCRKIMNHPLPFSEPVSYWVHRKWAYVTLGRVALGKCRNIGNAFRKAKKAGITDRSLSYAECMEGVKACKANLHRLKMSAKALRKVHLRDCLIRAEDMEDKEKFKGILRVIECEENRATWRAIKRVADPPRLGAITKVQREGENGIEDITNMEEMCEEIQSVTERRFELAESAPATDSSLRTSVGFLADTEFAYRLVSGLEPIPDDVDEFTKIVIEEMQRLWSAEGHEHFLAFEIKVEDYLHFWRRINERTSSSISTLHFGIQKAACFSIAITSFLCDKLTVIGSYGCPPTRWSSGLQVMLEKVAGVALVNKLRAILLMEADYNFFNKWAFGHHALNRLYAEGYIPGDQYSQRESTAEDARLDNRLTTDLSRQLRIPLAAISVDADKCYDRINHIIMSLALLAIVGTASLVTTLLHPIQVMKFYQRTAYGDSKSFMGGRTNDNPLQGLCQGNGAAPACWLMISSILMHCYKRLGFGSNILSPMSLALILFLGEMYVDDTDLIVTKHTYRTAFDVQLDAQASVDAWGKLLISTGGALNPEKCYWYMVDYVWVDGEANYAPKVEWDLLIPMPDGSKQPINQLDVHDAQKMLGVWSCPSGKDKKHLDENIVKKYKTWIDRSKNGHLPAKLNWTSYSLKLWPGMRYGLPTLATPRKDIDGILCKLDYEALPLLGVNRSVKREWRNLPRAFGGIGLFNLEIEQAIGWANMLLQHYGSPTTVGLKCKASLEALQLELGCTGNPLTVDFKTYGILATPCWVKSIWERFHHYSFDIHLQFDSITGARERDRTITEFFVANGIRGMALRQLNRCRIALNAIFLSDITTASGRRLEEFVFISRIGRRSKYVFPREQPCSKDWKLWDEFWTNFLRRDGTLTVPVGKWIGVSHQLWNWFYDKAANTIWKRLDQGGWLEHTAVFSGRTTRGNRKFTAFRSWVEQDGELGDIISVLDDHGNVSIVDSGSTFKTTTDPLPLRSFWEFVLTQGGTWMWDFVEGRDDDMAWVASALRDHTAVIVTDGSFDRSKAPRVSGAGWIFACTKRRKVVFGAFHELSDAASSYRGELLGLTAVHLLISFVMEFYNIDHAGGSIHCDNKGALYQASVYRRRIKTNAHHADLLRNLRSIKLSKRLQFNYIHVKAHQDRHLSWDQLSFIQQLNVHCDDLAGQAVQASFGAPPRSGLDQLIPRETAAVIIDGNKQTSDVAKAARFALGRSAARRFFTRPIKICGESNVGGLGWTHKRFDSVDWESLRDVLDCKPHMYGIWLSKQTIGIAATRRNMARIYGLLDDRCPNCLCGPERADHLNGCLDPGRAALFDADVEELHRWMLKNGNTNPELAYFICKFFHGRGERRMMSLGDMSAGVRMVAAGFDEIGWVDVLHGRAPLVLREFQTAHCLTANCRLTGKDWMKAFVTKVLQISHGQWMYRNFSLHNKVRGHLALQHQKEVLVEIAHLATCRPEEVPPESRFLLEVEVAGLEQAPISQQEYWILAMKAAVKAGRRSGTSPPRVTPRRQPQQTTLAQRKNLSRLRRRMSQLDRQLAEDLDMSCGAWREKRRRSSTEEMLSGSNKRLRKPD